MVVKTRMDELFRLSSKSDPLSTTRHSALSIIYCRIRDDGHCEGSLLLIVSFRLCPNFLFCDERSPSCRFLFERPRRYLLPCFLSTAQRYRELATF